MSTGATVGEAFHAALPSMLAQGVVRAWKSVPDFQAQIPMLGRFIEIRWKG